MKSTAAIIVRILEAGHPIGVSERIIASVFKSISLPHSQMRIRGVLRHLADEGVVEIINEDEDEVLRALGGGGWRAKLTRQGLSVAGIAKRSAGVA